MHWTDSSQLDALIYGRPRPPRPDAVVPMRAAVEIELRTRSVAAGESFKVPPWMAQSLYLAGKAFPVDSADLLRMQLVKGPQKR